MDNELRKLLKKELRDVKQSIYKVILGTVMIIAILVLVMLQVLRPITIIAIVPLCAILVNEIANFQINKAVLHLMRYILGDDEVIEMIDEMIKQKEEEEKDGHLDNTNED